MATKRVFLFCLGFAALWFLGITGTNPARAAFVQMRAGLPGSPAFGYGVQIDPWGKNALNALEAARLLRVDWVGVDFNWAETWPQFDQAPDIEPLASFLEIAAHYRIPVLLTIRNAPAWALTENGPEPVLTSALLQSLLEKHIAIEAVELYPGANTQAGWGAAPSPEAYVRLLQHVGSVLNQNGYMVRLLVGGLAPVGAETSASNIQEADFLQSLYTLGAIREDAVIGMRLPVLQGGLAEEPGVENPTAFRSYEQIRRVMLTNGHEDGLVWITGFTFPLELQTPATIPARQADWLQQAYTQLGSQMFISAAFFGPINGSLNSGLNSSKIELVQAKKPLHLAMERLGTLIGLKGNPEETDLTRRSETNRFSQLDSIANKRMYSMVKLLPKPVFGN